MKIGRKTLLAALLAAALVVPTATANPGAGKGQGGGKPTAAGAARSGSEHGKPDWAGSAKGQAEKAEKVEKAGKARSDAAGGALQAHGAEHDNPAWICKLERESMGGEAFADEYGTNDNRANAFGKCVSEEAAERDGPSEDVQLEVSAETTASAEGECERADDEPAGGELPDEGQVDGASDELPAAEDECSAPETEDGDDQSDADESGSAGTVVEQIVLAVLRLLF